LFRILPIWLFAVLSSAFNVSVLAQDAEDATLLNDPTQRTIIRFLTTDDFPPFNGKDEEDTLTGFNIDLARSICQDQFTECDIKVLPWDRLLPVLKAGNADAVIAAHRVTAKIARDFSFSRRYFYTPARFAVRRNAPPFATTPTGLGGRSVAVVRGSAHAAYLAAFFRNANVTHFDTVELAREAVMNGHIDAVFDDGIGLVFWANGGSSKACCVLRGGPYFEPRYFGDGIAIILRKGDRRLQRMLNESIKRLQDNGKFREIVEKFFPIKIY